MAVLFGSLSLFILGLLLHVIIWKLSLPQKQTRALLLIFGSVFLLGSAISWLNAILLPGTMHWFPLSPLEWIQSAILFVSFTLSYVITYSAIEKDSPSMLMIAAIDRTGARGLEASRLEEMFRSDEPILSRMESLVQDGLVEQQGEQFTLTGKGKRLGQLFSWYRSIMGLEEGG